MKVPYVNIPAQDGPIKEELLNAMARVIDHGQFVLGEEVREFEQRFARLCGVRHAVGVNSGTDALILALRVLGIGPGDEVITVPNSFVSTAGSIAMAGAKPVFVDVGEDFNMNPELIEGAITTRTRAIIPVHLTGKPCDMAPITEIATARGIHVIEDCAQAVCAEYRGRRVGSFGIAGCFSFHPLKNLGSLGDGGIITTNDAGLCRRLRILGNVGLRERDECVNWSCNSRLDTIQAAALTVKLNYLEEWTEKRRGNAAFYRRKLAGISGLQVPEEQPDERAVYHTFIMQAENREMLKEYLEAKGIGTAVHYPVPIHLQKAAGRLGYGIDSFPVAEKQAGRILSLPVYPGLEKPQLEYVVECTRAFYTKDNIDLRAAV